MCTAIRELIEDGRKEGIEQGIKQGEEQRIAMQNEIAKLKKELEELKRKK